MTATSHRPSLRVGRDGQVAAVPAGCFDWTVHRRGDPVVFLTTSLPGLGPGDVLDARVEVECGARLTLTTQGPAAMLRTDTGAVQRWRLVLGEQAHVTFVPWVTLPFPQSRSSSEVEVELGPAATLCGWELLAVGRVARGERLDLSAFASRWRLGSPDTLLLDDRLRVDASCRPEALAALGGHTHLGTLYLAGLADDSITRDEIGLALGGLELAGASRPSPGLLVVRALDRTAERLERAFWPLVSSARQRAGASPLSPNDVARRWFGPPAERS